MKYVLRHIPEKNVYPSAKQAIQPSQPKKKDTHHPLKHKHAHLSAYLYEQPRTCIVKS